MAELSLNAATTTNMLTSVPDFKVKAQQIDEATTGYNYWYFKDWHKNLGYYKQIPELKKAIDALAMWSVGKGYTCDIDTKITLEHVTGWGEDTFDSIMWNMIVVKKVNGDAFAEIIRDPDTDTLINLKPLNPANIRICVDKKGLIDKYEELNASGEAVRSIPKNKMFHICNDRVASEIHGTSVIDACKWVIDARNEAMQDKRRIMHRNSIRVIEVDADDATALNTLKTQWASAVKNGEVMILPKGNTQFPDVPPLTTAEHSEWIKYLENFFYQAVGVPKVIMGGSAEYSEASSKVGYLTFEVPYSVEARQLEQDLWNQLYIKVEFEKPVSLKEEVQESEAKNTGQVGFQPTDAMATMGRVE